VGVWWVPIVLAAWFLVAIAAALCIGPVLRRSSEAREALDQQLRDMPDGHESSQDERRSSSASLSLRVPPPSDGTNPYTLKRNSTTSPSRMT
jgi:hypothetical protein